MEKYFLKTKEKSENQGCYILPKYSLNTRL